MDESKFLIKKQIISHVIDKEDVQRWSLGVRLAQTSFIRVNNDFIASTNVNVLSTCTCEL